MSTVFTKRGVQITPKLDRHTYRVQFHGNGWEYTKIWLVNILLVIITLGIYYPWAKVRGRRYLIGSFRLGGATGAFDYLAPPLAILFGMLLVGLFFTAYSALGSVSAWGGILFTVLFLALLPWAVARSMAFHARYTCYRLLRFSFRREYWPLYRLGLIFLGSMFVPLLPFLLIGIQGESPAPGGTGSSKIYTFVLLPLGVLLSLFVMFVLPPWLLWSLHRYKVERYSLGRLGFRFDATLSSYIGMFIRVTLLMLGIMVFFILVVLGLITLLLGMPGGDLQVPELTGPVVILIMAVLYGIALIPGWYFKGLRYQRFWNGVRLKGNLGRVQLSFPMLPYFNVQLRTTLAQVFTLGLARPWARIYEYRFLARHATFETQVGILDDLVQGDEKAVGAIGAEFVDLGGVDVDLGL